jgi:uncharacterized membrane protein
MCGWAGNKTTLLAACLVISACAREQEPVSPDSGSPASQPSVITPATAPQVAAEPQLPVDSGLSIKRGTLSLTQNRSTFQPCGEKDALWLLDQTDGVLMEALAAELTKEAPELYVEAYGERTAVTDDVPAARSYTGMFILEQVLYAGLPGEVRGCNSPAPNYIVIARGNEPFWAIEVTESQTVWKQPEDPKEIVLGAPQTQDSEGAVRYQAAGGGHEIELLIDAQTCRDSMSGEFFAYAARALLDGVEFKGCARVGR